MSEIAGGRAKNLGIQSVRRCGRRINVRLDSIHEGWSEQPGHRANISRESYDLIAWAVVGRLPTHTGGTPTTTVTGATQNFGWTEWKRKSIF